MTKKTTAKETYNGLTVNERLCVAGLMERFDAAARQRNREAMMSILRKLSLPRKYAQQWVDTLLGDTHFFYR